MNRQSYPPPEGGHNAGRWSGRWTPPGAPPPPAGNGPGGWDGRPGGYPAPDKRQLRLAVKRAVRLVLPSLLILFLVEYAFAFAAGGFIGAYAARAYWDTASFPPDTYYGIPYGLYDFLTGYLPVLAGEAAALVFLRARTGLRISAFFARPEVPAREARPAGGRFTPETPPLSGPALAGWVAFAAAAGIGVSMLGQVCAMVELNFLYSIGFPLYSPDFSTEGYTLFDTILCNLYICVAGPVIEELVFRGYLLRVLRRCGALFSVLVTAVFFALFHMNLVQLFTPLFVGAFLALLTLRTKSLIPAICCHILNNTLSTLTSYIPFSSDFALGLFTLGQIALFLAVFALFWALWGRTFRPFLRDGGQDGLRLSEKLGAAFTSWPSAVFICVYIGMIAYSTVASWLMAGSW